MRQKQKLARTSFGCHACALAVLAQANWSYPSNGDLRCAGDQRDGFHVGENMNVFLLRNLGLLLSTALVATLAAETAFANEVNAACPGYTQCPQVDFAKILATDPDSLRNEDEITATERRALAAAAQPGLTLPEKKAALGAILAFDRNLSVNRNQACMSCHTPSAGFAGGVSALNTTTATFPGSVRIRTVNRKPESLAYGVFAPVLYYSPSISDARRGGAENNEAKGVIRKVENSEANFIGGNFLDLRATGLVTGSPSADQAMAPPTNPLEMALPDHACAIYRISRGSYADVFRTTGGPEVWTLPGPAMRMRYATLQTRRRGPAASRARLCGSRARRRGLYLDGAIHRGFRGDRFRFAFQFQVRRLSRRQSAAERPGDGRAAAFQRQGELQRLPFQRWPPT